MSNVTSAIPAFIGGVSQQSPALRLLTQCQAMDNAHVTIADGLMQKPNSDLVKVLGAITSSTGYSVHKIHRDVDEKYIVVFTNNATEPIHVFDLAGTELTMRYGYYDADGDFQVDANKKKYLTEGGITNSRKQIKACTIADYTIVINTEKTTAMKEATTDAKTDIAFVYFKGCHKGQYRITYKWKESSVNKSETWYVTPAYDNGILDEDTDSMMDNFITNNPDDTRLTITGLNNVLKIVPTEEVDGGTLHVDVSDPYGGHDLIPVNWCEVTGADKLPPQMPQDIIVKVGGDTDIQQDDYYMQYTFDTKIWSETIGWSVTYDLDEDTLPYRLMRTASDEFTFAPIKWEPRTVGDDYTNFVPSFIGQGVNGVLFAKNRLWLLSKQNVIGSKASDYFNFFSSTVMDVMDDDPIDVAGTGQRVTNMRSGVGFDNGLLLNSDEEQFALTSGENLLTPKTVAIDSTTVYASDPNSPPLKLGADVYFASPKGSYFSLREYTIMPQTLMKDAYDVTAHVPKYIPIGDVLLAGCNTMDMLFLWTSAEPKNLYIHQFLWDGNRKAQQAWYRWTYADDIYGIVTFGTVLYILFYNETDSFRLEKVNLENIPFTGQAFRYCVDSLMKLDNGSFDDPDTTYDLPMDVGDGTDWTVIDSETHMELSSGFTLANTTLTLIADDTSELAYFVGRKYTATCRFSEWYMRDRKEIAVIAGDLVIRNLTLSFIDTGYFRIEVTPFQRDTATEVLSKAMSGIRVDESVIGEISLLSGEETFLIMANSRRTVIELITDSYLPMAIQTGAWQGTFVIKGKI
ncbi:MAG: hypothetical protein E3J94_04925 [Desulfobacteraceae bacterium]|nr:MAG: hypothetical protein E3J94_04925 [Desulfobacteraceae bacterium]